MKILLAHKFFKYTGGADVFFFEVGRVLKNNGHEVAYFSTQDEDNLKCEQNNYFVKAPDYKDGNLINKSLQFLKIPYNFSSKNNFSKLIEVFQPDIVHVFNIMTHISPSILDIAKRKKIPIIISCNDYKHICPNSKLFHHGKICEECKGNRFYKCTVNKCSHNSLINSVASSLESYVHTFLNIYKKNIDLFLFASDFMAFKTEEFWGKGTFKWAKLLNPYNIPEIQSDERAGSFGLYFGRLIEEKGVHILVGALKSAKEIPFKIVGDGPDIFQLKKIVKDAKLHNIEFVGALWGNELNNLLYKCKFVVVPSIYNENFPYVILQSFAAGKPVIGTNRGGIPELVLDNERGLIYEANNILELTKKLRILWKNDSICIAMGKKARLFVFENFNDTVFYEQLISNYKKVLK